MDRVSQVVQSHEDLKFDNTLRISVGVIEFPKGGHGTGLNSSVKKLKTSNSVVYIHNDVDLLCLARSLVVCRAYDRLQKGEITKNMYMKYC